MTRLLQPLCLLAALAAPLHAQASQSPGTQSPGSPSPASQDLASQDAPGAPVGEDAPAAFRPVLPTEVMPIQLRSGALHWAEVVEHDDEGLLLRRIEHGGMVRMSWSLMDPLQAEALRREWGYIAVEAEELLIAVERLVLHNGSEILGVIESREGDSFVVRREGNVQVVPKRTVASISGGAQVPALDVYSRDQLYAQEAARTSSEDAAAQLALATYCERILDYVSAVRHYEAALALEVEGADEVAQQLARAQAKAERQEQVDYLHDTQLLQRRGLFDEALARLEAFATTFPASPLLEEAQRAKANLLSARERALVELIERKWSYWARRLTRSGVGDRSFEAAAAYAVEELGKEIRERVLADAQALAQDLELEQLDALWVLRERGRFAQASYGTGTWLLGEDRALAGIPAQASAQAQGGGEKDAERAALEQKIKRFLENQQRARRAQSSAEKADSIQAGWAALSTDGKAQWLHAYYVEFGGDYELRDRPYLRSCSSCGGRGVSETITVGGRTGQDGGTQLQPCAICRGIGSVRRVYFR